MAIYYPDISSALSGNYAASNEIVGKIWSFLSANDSNINLVSDSNPDSSVARVILIQYGSCPHLCKIFSSTTSTVVIAVLKLDGVTALKSVLLSNNTDTLKVMISGSITLLQDATSAAPSIDSLFIVKCADGAFFTAFQSSGGNNATFFVNNADTAVYQNPGTTWSQGTEDGRIMLTPLAIPLALSGVAYHSPTPALWYAAGLSDYTWYSDGSGINYFCTKLGVVVSDG